jgi:hypothetical protein
LRVLRDDGFVVYDKLNETAYMCSVGTISAIDVLYGHRTGFTQRTLGNVLAEAHFPY